MELIQKRTKIVATIGPASRDPEIIRSLVLSGANVFRLNFSHGEPAEHGATIDAIRTIAAELETHIAVLQDLPGPKVRTGKLAGDASSVHLERGTPFTLTTEDQPGDSERVSVSYRHLPADVEVDRRIYLQDGAIVLRILDKSATEIHTMVEVGGDLRPSQGINYPDGSLNLAAVSERDLEFLAFGLEKDVDYVAVSFVRTAEDVARVKAFIAERKKTARVLAKIEKHEALEDIENIITHADGIMVARGDLGIEIPLERVPLVQKDLIARCNRASKPVVTATQMLESMTVNPRPTRAETTDVANAILDGTDAVMLSAETAAGAFPRLAVEAMRRIICEVECHPLPWRARDQERGEAGATVATEEAIAAATIAANRMLGTPLVIVLTKGGFSARVVSSHRPRVPILALTDMPQTYRQLALVWGIVPHLVAHCTTYDEMVALARQAAVDLGLARPGDRVLVTAGVPFDVPGTTNLLKVETV